MPKLFERFFRAGTSAGIVGTGIGLRLVKQLVEMHGGAVTAQSIEGEGSTFTVRMPLKPAADTARPGPAALAAPVSPRETRR